MIRIGIEHEFTFKDHAGNYLDFDNTEATTFQNIIDDFPYIENDGNLFECKSLEKLPKRCYLEGFERYNLEGSLIKTLPKGVEIRTAPHDSVDALMDDFLYSYNLITQIAARQYLSPLHISYHPFKTSCSLKKSLNRKETSVRTEKELDFALKSMLLQAFHVNVSLSDRSHQQMNDLVQKINYYFPYIIPFSFSSPFYDGKVFEGLSYRNYFRSGRWELVNIKKRNGIDVIEFSGFDACGDIRLMKALILLFKGLVLDEILMERSVSQDAKILRLSSLKGFGDRMIKQKGQMVLKAAKNALGEEGKSLDFLEAMLTNNDSYAAKMKNTFFETGDIMACISNQFNC